MCRGISDIGTTRYLILEILYTFQKQLSLSPFCREFKQISLLNFFSSSSFCLFLEGKTKSFCFYTAVAESSPLHLSHEFYERLTKWNVSGIFQKGGRAETDQLIAESISLATSFRAWNNRFIFYRGIFWDPFNFDLFLMLPEFFKKA